MWKHNNSSKYFGTVSLRNRTLYRGVGTTVRHGTKTPSTVLPETEHFLWLNGLPMVKWLRQEGRIWDKDKMSVAATIGGNLDILKFVLNEGCPWDPYAVFIARRNNKPEILQFTAKHWSFINMDILSIDYEMHP